MNFKTESKDRLMMDFQDREFSFKSLKVKTETTVSKNGTNILKVSNSRPILKLRLNTVVISSRLRPKQEFVSMEQFPFIQCLNSI